MDNLKLYLIEDKYIRYLSTRDGRVQNNKDKRRPYVGIVLEVDAYKYFVPMESPKPNHANIKPGKHIMKIGGGKYGLLGFNNMIPVPDSALVNFNIDAIQDSKYRELLRNQIDIINDAKLEVHWHATETYRERVTKKNGFLIKICCDFKMLEKACKKYDPTR